MGLVAPRFAGTKLTLSQIEPCLDDLRAFAGRYAPFFYRSEQGQHARIMLEGLLSDLPRKTIEPIAIGQERHRRALQHFVGAGHWEDEEVLSELHRHIAEEIGDPMGLLILDSSGFPKKGTQSVGVKRQWCNRLGKVDNCQVGVFLAYVGQKSATLVDRALFLPKEWARDPVRRKRCHVPSEVGFRSKVQIGYELLQKDGDRFPHDWILGDDEYGRAGWLRQKLDRQGEQYLLDVPENTKIRDLEAIPRGVGKTGRRRRKNPFQTARTWLKRQGASAWKRVLVREGEKEQIQVDAVAVRVQAVIEGRVGHPERLLVTRTIASNPEWHFYLGNPREEITLAEMVRAASGRHHIEETLQTGKGDAGLRHYEVRSWVGWHHHMTLSLLAQWFLVKEQRGAQKKDAGSDRLAAGLGGSSAPAPQVAAA